MLIMTKLNTLIMKVMIMEVAITITLVLSFAKNCQFSEFCQLKFVFLFWGYWKWGTATWIFARIFVKKKIVNFGKKMKAIVEYVQIWTNNDFHYWRSLYPVFRGNIGMQYYNNRKTKPGVNSIHWRP